MSERFPQFDFEPGVDSAESSLSRVDEAQLAEAYAAYEYVGGENTAASEILAEIDRRYDKLAEDEKSQRYDNFMDEAQSHIEAARAEVDQVLSIDEARLSTGERPEDIPLVEPGPVTLDDRGELPDIPMIPIERPAPDGSDIPMIPTAKQKKSETGDRIEAGNVDRANSDKEPQLSKQERDEANKQETDRITASLGNFITNIFKVENDETVLERDMFGDAVKRGSDVHRLSKYNRSKEAAQIVNVVDKRLDSVTYDDSDPTVQARARLDEIRDELADVLEVTGSDEKKLNASDIEKINQLIEEAGPLFDKVEGLKPGLTQEKADQYRRVMAEVAQRGLAGASNSLPERKPINSVIEVDVFTDDAANGETAAIEKTSTSEVPPTELGDSYDEVNDAAQAQAHEQVGRNTVAAMATIRDMEKLYRLKNELDKAQNNPFSNSLAQARAYAEHLQDMKRRGASTATVDRPWTRQKPSSAASYWPRPYSKSEKVTAKAYSLSKGVAGKGRSAAGGLLSGIVHPVASARRRRRAKSSKPTP